MTWTFDRTGNHLALDFANTVSERAADVPIDRLPGYADLVAFAEQTGLVSRAEAGRLRREAGRRPQDGAAVLRDAAELRDAIYELAVALARGDDAPPGALDRFNRALQRMRLDSAMAWSWSARDDGLDRFLGAIVRAALELFTGDDRDRIRVCEAPTCLFVFFDSSRNRSRRWCDMKQCGNREKARRHYARHSG